MKKTYKYIWILICNVGMSWDIGMIIVNGILGNIILCIMPICGVIFWILIMTLGLHLIKNYM